MYWRSLSLLQFDRRAAAVGETVHDVVEAAAVIEVVLLGELALANELALSIPALAIASGSRSAAFVCEGLLRAKVCSVPASSVGAAVRIQHARSFPVISHLIQDILNITSSNRAGAFTHRERPPGRPLVSMSTGGRRGVTGGGRRENVSKRALARCL